MEAETDFLVYSYIFARGGSKGVPHKNIRDFAGKPLIAHTIEIALASQFIDRVIVSTDDQEIAGIAEQFGAEVPFIRPSELAGDKSPEWLAWKHAIRELQKEPNCQMDIFVALPTTSPLRKVEDIDNCILSLKENDADIVITVKNASRHPSFNMVTIDNNKYARLVIPPAKVIHRRQETLPVYDVTTVAYVAKPDFILNADSIFDGKVKVVVIPEERAVDIDSEMDFDFAEFLFARKNKF